MPLTVLLKCYLHAIYYCTSLIEFSDCDTLNVSNLQEIIAVAYNGMPMIPN